MLIFSRIPIVSENWYQQYRSVFRIFWLYFASYARKSSDRIKI